MLDLKLRFIDTAWFLEGINLFIEAMKLNLNLIDPNHH